VRRNRKLVVALVLVAAACSRSGSSPQVGSLAPDFRAEDLTGRTLFLNAELERPVVLTFFASWCAPCREEVSRFIGLHDRFGDDATILCVVVDPENKDEVRSLASGLRIPYPMLMDEGQRIRSSYAVWGLPATFVVGTDGRIHSRFSYVGEDEARALVETVERIAGKR
jgi:peroxiredoxin